MSDADRYPSAMPADITNQEFLTGLFDDDWWRVHVTAFPGDPTIQDGRWAGGWHEMCWPTQDISK